MISVPLLRARSEDLFPLRQGLQCLSELSFFLACLSGSGSRDEGLPYLFHFVIHNP